MFKLHAVAVLEIKVSHLILSKIPKLYSSTQMFSNEFTISEWNFVKEFTYFLPMAKTPYKAAVIIIEPQPTNVETLRQNIIGRMAILQNVDKEQNRINIQSARLFNKISLSNDEYTGQLGD